MDQIDTDEAYEMAPGLTMEDLRHIYYWDMRSLRFAAQREGTTRAELAKLMVGQELGASVATISEDHSIQRYLKVANELRYRASFLWLK